MIKIFTEMQFLKTLKIFFEKKKTVFVRGGPGNLVSYKIGFFSDKCLMLKVLAQCHKELHLVYDIVPRSPSAFIIYFSLKLFLIVLKIIDSMAISSIIYHGAFI